MLNIDSSDDPFYRYKMDNIVVKSHKHGTELINLETVASQLNRSKEFIELYIAVEYGSKFKGNVLYSKNTSSEIQKCIYEFIGQFVLCTQCNNPETDFVVEGRKKNYVLKLDCRSCGKKQEVEDHKIVKTIINSIINSKFKKDSFGDYPQ